MFKRSAVAAEQIRQLADMLIECAIGEQVTNRQIERVIGSLLKHRNRFQAALQLANAETGALFVNLKGVGYERIHAEETHTVGRKARRRVRNLSRAANKFMTNSVRYANLSNEALLKTYAEQAQLGLFDYLSRDRNVVKIDSVDGPVPTTASVKSTMEALRQAELDRHKPRQKQGVG